MDPKTTETLDRASLARMRRAMRCCEHVALCIDVGAEMASPWGAASADRSRMDVLRHSLGTFLRRKANSPYRHRFSVVTFGGTAPPSTLVPFTEAAEASDALGALVVDEGSPAGPYNFAGLLDHLEGSFTTLDAADTVVRAIIVFGRSYDVPSIPAEHGLVRHPAVVLDVLYLHARLSEPNVRCQEVLDALAGLEPQDPVKTAYFLETGPSSMKLLLDLGLLLAHPAQRDFQDDMAERANVTSERIEELRPPPEPVAVAASAVATSVDDTSGSRRKSQFLPNLGTFMGGGGRK
mmetsp:Transcript_6903/g.23286  ORF Transcript_6903/g.23286 Transcript_6903/m.23286 type:complete len:293 (-) Transcript_6903:30-908(-)